MSTRWGVAGLIAMVLLLGGFFDIHSLAGIERAVRAAAFQVVSLITTTGFVTDNYNLWPYFTQMMLLFLMLLGGCAGSTGGGVKRCA